jgi:hypothetical protein
MIVRVAFTLALSIVVMASCGSPPLAKGPSMKMKTTFDDDVRFLEAHGPVIVLRDAARGGAVALSAHYQGRVMTSAVAPSAQSLGWIHRAFIASGKTATPFDNYGGEDRFWLGPEGGQFGLHFPPGAPFDFDRWQTPHALQEGAWKVAEQNADRVVFTTTMALRNWSGSTFRVDVERTVRLLGPSDAERVLGIGPGELAYVGFETRNRIVNAGTEPWTRETGLLSIWILAMFAPAADARVLVPFEPSGTGPIVNDAYFGKVPPERLAVRDGYLAFTCDGNVRGKIGLSPTRAKSYVGSYSASSDLLTIVHYDGPKRDQPYVNSMWEMQKEPYGGDAVNSYNDGPPGPGKPRLGGFYEIETSSPAAALAPGAEMVHTHRTFHFVGKREALLPIAKRTLGVSALGASPGE